MPQLTSRKDFTVNGTTVGKYREVETTWWDRDAERSSCPVFQSLMRPPPCNFATLRTKLATLETLKVVFRPQMQIIALRLETESWAVKQDQGLSPENLDVK